MPPKKARARRSRSPSVQSASQESTNAPSPATTMDDSPLPAAQRQRCSSRSSNNTSPAVAVALRTESEWALVHGRSMMVLAPTPAMVAAAGLRCGSEGSINTSTRIYLRIAAFDVDDTVIRYKGGRSSASSASAADPEEWEWFHPSVPAHLRQLHAHGCLITFFSNQAGINGLRGGWNETKAKAIQRKIVSVAGALEVPVAAYVSTAYDQWRKPMPGMWGQLQEDLAEAVRTTLASSSRSRSSATGELSSILIDCQAQSFFVGDAAGRPPGPGRPKKDFSCSDRRFAYNLGLPFYTPAQFFELFPDTAALCAPHGTQRREKGGGTCLSDAFQKALEKQPPEVFEWGGVGPDELRAIPSTYAGLTVTRITANAGAEAYQLPNAAPFFSTSAGSVKAVSSSSSNDNIPLTHPQEMVVLVGPPSCGKSTFYRRHLQPLGFQHVNRDTLRTKEKCLRTAEQLWKAGHSVAIDNTNPTRSDRRLYVDLVRKLTGADARRGAASAAALLPVRFTVWDCPKSLALHLNAVRARRGQAARIPEVAYHTYFARYEPVTEDEMRSTGVEGALVLPPVVSFDDLPPHAKREFYMLS